MDDVARRRLNEDLTRLADGDRSAFHPVFRAAWPHVLSVVRALVEPSDVEDTAQRTLMKLFEEVARFDPTRDAAAWIAVLALNEARTTRSVRTRRREAGLSEIDGFVSNAPSPEAIRQQRELRERLFSILGQLHERDRETIDCLLDERRPNIDGATFRKRVQRALARLTATWRATHGD